MFCLCGNLQTLQGLKPSPNTNGLLSSRCKEAGNGKMAST
ncbi:unnamed protein product [Ixodes persulcatus]